MKKILIAIVVVLILGLGYWALVKKPGNSTKQQAEQKQEQTQTPSPSENKVAEIKAVPVEQKPENFPSEIPLENGAEIVLNFDAVNSKGEIQGTRDFLSAKTIEENFAFYSSFFKENGWNITDSQEKTDAGWLIFAQKGSNSVNVRIYSDTEKKTVRVSLNNIVKK